MRLKRSSSADQVVHPAATHGFQQVAGGGESLPVTGKVSAQEELDRLAGPDGAERAIRKLVDQKVVRFRGFSCHDPALTLRAIERLAPDAIEIDTTESERVRPRARPVHVHE